MSSKREHIAREILSSERQYVDFLKTLHEVYDIALKQSVGNKAHKPMMSQQEVSLVFGLLPPIYTGAGEFLEKLTTIMDSFDAESTLLSTLFLENEAYFNDYSPYVNHFTEISEQVHRSMAKNDVFKAWIMEMRKNPRVQDKYLIDFLIMPVQRIPRYSLLLRELTRETPANHPDAAGLALALQKVDQIGSFLNDQKRKAEDFSRILALQDKLTGKLSEEFKVTAGYRKILREEQVMLVTPTRDGTWKERKVTLLLLSDMLLVCDRKKVFSEENLSVKKYFYNNEMMHVVRPFLQSVMKRQLFQLLRRSGASRSDRRSMHIGMESGSGMMDGVDSGGGGGGIENSSLASLFLSSTSAVDALMGSSKAAEAGALAVLFLKRGGGNGLMQRLVRAESAACDIETDMFRIPSVRSVVVFRYLRLVASDYLVQTLAPVFESIMASPEQAVDPDGNDPTVAPTVTLLAKRLLDALCSSASQIPGELRSTLNFVSELVAAKTEGAEISVLAHLLIEKVIFPALTQPELHGLATQELSPGHSRLMELLRSTILKAATGRFFPEASSAAFMNKQLSVYQRRMAEFISESSQFDRYSTQYPRSPKIPALMFQTALMDLQACVAHDLPVFSKSIECYDAVAEALAMDSIGPYAQTESLLFYPLDMEGRDEELVKELEGDWLRDLTLAVDESKSGPVQATPRGVMNPTTKSSMLHRIAKTNVLADAAKKAKETLSRFAPTEEEIHRNLRGKVIQSGYMWERRFFTVTEFGIFVQESPKSSEMAPMEIDHPSAKAERIEGVPEWEHALRLYNSDIEYSLMSDSEEEMFRWKNAFATLRVKEEANAVRRAQDSVQTLNKGTSSRVSGSHKRSDSKAAKRREKESSVPSDKEAMLLSMLSANQGGDVAATSSSSSATGTSTGASLSARSSVTNISPQVLKRDEKQQQMIREASSNSGESSNSSKRRSSSNLSSSSNTIRSKGKFSTLVGRVKGELMLKRGPSTDNARRSSSSEEMSTSGRQSSPGNLEAAAAQTPVRNAVATFKFSPEEDGELAFEIGDVLEVYKFDAEGWGRGKNMRTSEVGEFPCNRTDICSVPKEEDESVSEEGHAPVVSVERAETVVSVERAETPPLEDVYDEEGDDDSFEVSSLAEKLRGVVFAAAAEDDRVAKMNKIERPSGDLLLEDMEAHVVNVDEEHDGEYEISSPRALQRPPPVPLAAKPKLIALKGRRGSSASISPVVPRKKSSSPLPPSPGEGSETQPPRPLRNDGPSGKGPPPRPMSEGDKGPPPVPQQPKTLPKLVKTGGRFSGSLSPGSPGPGPKSPKIPLKSPKGVPPKKLPPGPKKVAPPKPSGQL